MNARSARSRLASCGNPKNKFSNSQNVETPYQEAVLVRDLYDFVPWFVSFSCTKRVYRRRLSITAGPVHSSWRTLDKPLSSLRKYTLSFDIMRSSGFLLSAALLIGSAVDVLGGVSPL